jgi:hypothetical protein
MVLTLLYNVDGGEKKRYSETTRRSRCHHFLFCAKENKKGNKQKQKV